MAQMKGMERRKFIREQTEKVLGWLDDGFNELVSQTADSVLYECQGQAPLDTDVDMNKKEMAEARRQILKEIGRLARKGLKKRVGK